MADSETSVEPFDFAFVRGPGALDGYLNTLHTFRTDRALIEDVMPAYSPQIVLVSHGRAAMRFADGRIGTSSSAFAVTQLDAAAAFRIEGPFEAVGASLTSLGWASLSGLRSDEWKNRVLPIAEALPRPLAARIEELARDFADGRRDARNTAAALGEALATGLAPPNPEHRQFIADMQHWLSSTFDPKLPEFVARSPHSQRTVQRLAKRYFGAPPVAVIKRFRAIRASTLLTMPALPAELEAEIFAAFYDQSHLIRELRRFTGRTPSRLAKAAGSLAAETLGVDGYGHGALAEAIDAAEADARD